MSRAHAGPVASIQPAAPLSDPIILWDTRSWDGSFGAGTGGLPNEGTAGAAFDLDVYESIDSVNGAISTYACQGTGPFAGWVTPSGIDWDDMGGAPIDGPFTIITAIGSFAKSSPVGAVGAEGQVDVEVILGDSPSVRTFGTGTIFFTLDNDQELDGYMDLFHNGAAPGSIAYDFYEPVKIPGGDCPDCAEDFVRERLLVMTMDGVDGGGSFWRIGLDGIPVPVTPRIDGTGPAPLVEEFNVDDTFQNAVGPSAPTDSRFALFGYDVRNDGPLTPGEQWNGPLGFVLLRGEPTQADLAYWHAYFFTGYTPYVAPLPSYEMLPPGGGSFPASATKQVTWFDDTYVYHWHQGQPAGTINSTFLRMFLTPIAGMPLPSTIDFILVGAGENAATSVAVGNTKGGGGGAGEVKEILGHPAPVAASQFNVGFGTGSSYSGNVSFEGYTCQGIVNASSFPFRSNGGNGFPFGPYTGGTGSTGVAGGGGRGAAGNGGNRVGTTGGDGGPGIASTWHWTRTTTRYHGVGGYGRGSINGVAPGWNTGLGHGALGAFVNGNPGIQRGGPCGIVIRYLRQD